MKGIIGAMASVYEKYSMASNAMWLQLNRENMSMETLDSTIPTLSDAEPCTSLTIAEILKDTENFSISRTGDLQLLVSRWADSIHPNRTPQDTLVKLLEEIAELFKDPTSEEELADVAILVLDLFHLTKVNMGRAVLDKMRVNARRKWKIDLKTGIMSHV